MRNAREQRLFQKWQPALEKVADGWGKSAAEIFNTLAAADPSDEPAFQTNGKKLYLDWLCHMATGKKPDLTADNLADTTLMLRLHLGTPNAPGIYNFKNPTALHDAVAKPMLAHFADLAKDDIGLRPWASMEEMPHYRSEFPAYAVKTLVEADPAKGRDALHIFRWMSTPAGWSDTLLPEDLPKATEDLTLFYKHRAQLYPATQRHLEAYGNYRDLAAAMDRFRPEFAADKRSETEDYVLEQNMATQLADTPHFRLIHITSVRGAQLLGKGTRWCTSWGDGDGKHNWFPTYQDGLLYLRTKNNNSIYQLHFGKWMHNDAQDQPIKDFPDFVKSLPELRDVLLLQHTDYFVAGLKNLVDDFSPKRGLIGALDLCSELVETNPTLLAGTQTAITAALRYYAKDTHPQATLDLLAYCSDNQSYKPLAQTAANIYIGPLFEAMLETRNTGIWDSIHKLGQTCTEFGFGAPVKAWHDERLKRQQDEFDAVLSRQLAAIRKDRSHSRPAAPL